MKNNINKTIKIIYEDMDLIAINKPAGLLVHETGNKESNTLVNYIVRHNPEIKKINWPQKNRPGIVHRLDRDTSGIIIIAKNLKTYTKLAEQFKTRKIQKEYLALVIGKLPNKTEAVFKPIGRKKSPKLIMTSSFGKNAETHFETLQEFHWQNYIFSKLLAIPKTGRTHQIRVHLKFLGLPILGDLLYGKGQAKKIAQKLKIKRQLLHAYKITFLHPTTNKVISFKAKIPQDFNNILQRLSKK
ncbi:MAG TPA: RluA family pseudouridine synthase [Patescibacteria group bacterium]|nr:RluA family pseudouridine synthase [Patescibacteria group bacterium]